MTNATVCGSPAAAVATRSGSARAASAEIQVMHVITGLGAGGAEAMLYKLVSATPADGLSHSVVSLTDDGVFGAKLVADGVPVTCLGMRRGVPNPLALGRLVRLLRRRRPDVIQGWMYHANLVAGVAGSIARIPVVWGIHHSDVDPRNAKRLTNWTRSVCALLSGALPARIVSCADSALRSHVRLGYRADRMLVIPNGFVSERLAASSQARAQVRRELDIPDDAPLVGVIARVHPDKDHRNFLAAASLVSATRRDAVFLLAGDGASPSNAMLSGWIDASGMGRRVRMLGFRSDVPRLLAALDVLVSSSRGEGFPQILGEAMLCGIPCVATDCGDSREILGTTGWVVPIRDPAALARGILDALALSPSERAALGAAARERIVERYELRVVARRYADLYAEVHANHARTLEQGPAKRP